MNITKKQIKISILIIIIACILGFIGYLLMSYRETKRTREYGGTTECTTDYCFVGTKDNPRIQFKINKDHIVEIIAYQEVIYFDVTIKLKDIDNNIIKEKLVVAENMKTGAYCQYDLKLGLTQEEINKIHHYSIGWHHVIDYDK